jgi:hypothetical protein
MATLSFTGPEGDEVPPWEGWEDWGFPPAKRPAKQKTIQSENRKGLFFIKRLLE